MTLKQRIFTLLALILALAFNATALPMTPAKQVSVTTASLSHSTNTTVQGVLEDMDESIPGLATTGTVGTVRFATPVEVGEGTTGTVVTPADLRLSFGLVPYAHFRNEKSSGSASQTLTEFVDNTLVLNTTVTNWISGAALSSNQISLPAGTYRISAWCPIDGDGSNDAKLRAIIHNATATNDLLLGISSHMCGDDQFGLIFVNGLIDLSSPANIEFRGYITRNWPAGVAVSDGRNEIYAEIEIWKLK
jgi:hypothetical protein